MPTLDTTILLSLVRGRQGISAWVSRSSLDGTSPVVVSEPLEKLTVTTFPQRDSLLDDWTALGTARDINAIWPAFWRVFWATQSEAQENSPTAMPRQTVPAVAPIATAAHPRAFRGTKFQPSKKARVELDLHTWLADHRLLDGLFAQHDFARWPMLGPDGLPSTFDADRYGLPTAANLLAQHGVVDNANLPIVFRRLFLWRLRTAPAHNRNSWLGLWRASGAPLQGDILAMLALLSALAPAAHSWAELGVNLPQARQVIFLKRVLGRRSYLLPDSQLSAEQLTSFDAICDDDVRFDAIIDVALANLNRGASIAYTLIGSQLPEGGSSIETTTRELTATVQCDEVPVSDIARMLAVVGDSGTHWARRVWRHCAEQAGFVRILNETQWELFCSEMADWWLSLFSVTEWEFETPAQRAAQWRVRLFMFPELQKQVLNLPREWRAKFIRMQRDYVTGWDDPHTLQQSWPVLLPLQAALCRAPFGESTAGDSALSAVAIHLPAAGWQKLAAMPERTWLVIEHACRRDNSATLVRYGINGLTEAMPEFVLRCLHCSPKRLMRSMSLIGCLEHNARRRFLYQVAVTSWFSTVWEEMEALEACRRVLALCVEYGVDSPLPRRLREHLAGTLSLTETQLARHCGLTLARLPATQLAALEVMAWRHIDGPFQLRSQSSAADHAVRLHASIDGGNKKMLRRFLLGYAEGGVHAFLDHPLNRSWYARHPRVDPSIWGSDQVRLAAGHGSIQIAIETDPLEILKLGSYVGSCLGLGGLCDYSTVACLVDANKQVAYARDANGRVVARQLLAIDEGERLVCFAVYPYTKDETLLQAFKQFDEMLADALGLDIYRDNDKNSYDVRTILAIEWWDDGAWAT